MTLSLSISRFVFYFYTEGREVIAYFILESENLTILFLLILILTARNILVLIFSFAKSDTTSVDNFIYSKCGRNGIRSTETDM